MLFFTEIEHDTPNTVLHLFGRRLPGETHGRLVQESLLLHVQILNCKIQMNKMQQAYKIEKIIEMF